MGKNMFSLKYFFRPLLPKFGGKIFPANLFFLRPVLSYFAEFSAGWQQWSSLDALPSSLLPSSSSSV
jgi:hypothetical protein